MKNTIYNKIQETNKLSFDELYKQCSELNISKQELGQELRTLETEKLIFQYNNAYHDLQSYPLIEGYAQWGLNGFCWLENKNTANAFGISYNLDDNLTTIYNKRDTFYGNYIIGREITDNDKTFVIVTESKAIMDLQLIATFDANKDVWVIINSNTSFSFPNTLENISDGNISIFNYLHDDNSFHFSSHLGNKEDFGIESKIIEVLAEIKAAPTTEFIQTASALKKLDKEFYTIDSIHTSDVDDAIWIEENDIGYKLYVAIADVSSYVIRDDEQDKHAQNVCTSNYLPHHVTHMLDRKLAESFCSLNVGETKTALISEMQFNFNGDMLSKEFYQSEVTIHARLSYDDVDRIVENNNPVESYLFSNNQVSSFNYLTEAPAILTSLKYLEKFSQLKERHQDRNYFIVENPEYHLGENGKIDYLYLRDETHISQKMVESAMISANIAAAQLLFEKYPQFGMFRNQYEPPNEDKPKPAFYHVANEGHWGLQTDFYTQFTSPIRRYCDLVVHRLIKGILNNEDVYTNEELKKISDNMNMQQYKSKQCDIKAKNLLLPQYLESLSKSGNLNSQLEVVDFSANGVVCRNPQLIEIFIPSFKLESYVTRVLEKFIPADGSELNVEQKTQAVATLNKTWDIYMQLGQYAWTDERKNALYQFQRKQFVKKPSI